MEHWPLRKSKSSAYWLVIYMMITAGILVVGQIEGGCIEEERKALLEIKASLKFNGDDIEDRLLRTWVDHGSSDSSVESCCAWERVTCNTTTGHVTELSLEQIWGIAYKDYSNKIWPLNFSVFLHFKELTSLNLSYDFLDNGIESTGLEKLSALKKLEILNLSSNYIENNSIFRSLGALTSLRILDLSTNDLFGYFPAQELAALENLEMLDLSYSGFYGTFQAHGFERFSILRKLETLNLGYNEFNESLIASLSALPSLKALDLQGNQMSGSFPAQELAHLSNLEKVDLTFTGLDGSSTIQGCKSLSRLKRLKSIALRSNIASRSNSFNMSIISCLSALPSLKNLDLRRSNMLGSSFLTQELSGLRKLETLDLSYCGLDSLAFNGLPNLSDLKVLLLRSNRFNGALPLEGLASFRHLEVLDLSGNRFVGSIPSAIRALSSLRVLILAKNKLNGSLPNHEFCELKNLVELDLSENMFEGNLPQCFNSLPSLKLFDISSNQFTGTLLPSLIANLMSLEYIDLSHNKFEGSFSFSSFSNHTNLEVVEFISDDGKFEVETEEPSGWIPMFQLKVLILSNCNLNRPARSVPSFLLHQHKLRVLDLSHNSLEGQFPHWLIDNSTELEFFNIRNNSFRGNILMPPYRNVDMWWLDMSRNHINGTFPADIRKFLPNIIHLNLSGNALSGALPSSVGDLSELVILDLSDNGLSGEVPKGLFTNSNQLSVLKLSKNSLHGEVLSRSLSSSSLQMLLLDNNFFTGKIGNESEDLQLQRLDISNNLFSGVIPGWISNLTSLSTLVIRNNSFEGRFPCGRAPFGFLDISQNSFSGSIPSCLNRQVMKHLHLGSNRFTGSIPRSIRNLSNLLTLDVSNNNLSGKIPEFLGELSNLRILLLSKNSFTGPIPNQLCQLSNVSLMDLSSNSLSGSIPRCLQNITGPNHLAFIQIFSSSWYKNSFYHYGSVIQRDSKIHGTGYTFEIQDEVQFITKSMSYTYKGGILDYMSGLDLSCNNLTSEIPIELGLLSQILALNLSHNQLSGSIPMQFSNLIKLESLDLSSNYLSGRIPSELIKLNFLAVFIVANNNLSGRLPEMKAQFGTFNVTSYEGNPFLCGPPLKKCTTNPLPKTKVPSAEEGTEKWYDIDLVFFVGSFTSTWFVVLLGFAAVLYTNPYWRRRWLEFVEECMYMCYYFLCDSVRKLSVLLYN